MRPISASETECFHGRAQIHERPAGPTAIGCLASVTSTVSSPAPEFSGIEAGVGALGRQQVAVGDLLDDAAQIHRLNENSVADGGHLMRDHQAVAVRAQDRAEARIGRESGGRRVGSRPRSRHEKET